LKQIVVEHLLFNGTANTSVLAVLIRRTMNLTRYVAKWGWASLFVLLWIKFLGLWGGETFLLVAAFCAFGGITAISTGLYAYGLYRLNRYMERGYTVPYE